eukprot:TRINITY_DN38394_c0_g1_i1.p1 TRINITY_DN38394_c0_g1~~TRINITY_DN38394_c0_g1_i1.p1  ORF type:complete len:261 (+),score=47.79 TRINITY_DN38394_c0_g1_i1:53-835(+)
MSSTIQGLGLPSTSVVVALAVGAVSLIAFFLKRRSNEKSQPQQAKFPEDGIFTLEILKRFDGVTGPICMGVCGKVVDVSTSENISVGEGYGKLWAGRDATYSLATLSLKPDDANILDYTIEQFTPDQHKALAGWYKHFTTKYTIVGRLKEYDGWDFSSVEEAAKNETPFGAGKTPAAAEPKDSEKKADSKDEAAKAPDPSQGVMLRAGDYVMLQGLDGKKELNGRVGILRSFQAETGRFSIEVEGLEKPILVKPGNVSKA